MIIERVTPAQGKPVDAPCACEETRIAYKRPDGVTALAPVSIRCATHRTERRARDERKRSAIASIFARITARLPLALPAPCLQQCRNCGRPDAYEFGSGCGGCNWMDDEQQQVCRG